MDKIFRLSMPGPDHEPLAALAHACGDSLESVLEIAVFRSREPGPAGSDGARLLAHRQLGMIGPDVYADWRFALDEQVTRWITAISYRGENLAPLERLSPTLAELSTRLGDVHPDWADVPFMRTVRMLLLFEALFLPEVTFESAQASLDSGSDESSWRLWRGRLHRKASALRQRSPQLRKIISDLSTAEIAIGTTGWRVSVPSLILLAVVYSQYEYYASVLWEAHSALRARDELQRRWETALKRNPCLHYCRDFVSLLIRYQSAAGKQVRQSGDDRFIAAAREFAETTHGSLTPQEVRSALALVGILGEARLRSLPGTGPDTPIGVCKLNAGVIQPWDSHDPLPRDWYLLDREDLTERELDGLGLSSGRGDPLTGRVFRSEPTLRRTLGDCTAASDSTSPATDGLIDQLVARARQTAESGICRIAAACQAPAETPSSPATRTWTYASRLDVCDDSLRTFRRFVEQHYRSLLDPEDHPLDFDPAVFSFGLMQARDLKQPLEECVDRVAQAIEEAPKERKREVGLEAFRTCFRLRRTQIPAGWAAARTTPEGETEHVVEIVLREEFAAWGLLLPGDAPPEPKADAIARAHTESAADLLDRLFQRASRKLTLTEHALQGDQYVPFPLFERMLDVVARLRPAESVSITVEFDGRRRRPMRLPDGLDAKRHQRLVRTIANYVHAVVLNRAMTQGFHSCDLSFHGLNDPIQTSPQTENPMTPERWKETIQEAYRQNCYEVLVDKYLRDYNTERRSLAFLDVSRPTTLKRSAPEDVAAELGPWIGANPREPADAAGCPRLLLGLDVGATLTKIQFYSIDAARLTPVGEPHQVNTPQLPDQSQPPAPDPADRFADELVGSVEQISRADADLRAQFEGRQASILSVGVSWPGPVRHNHLAGTSAILANFPPLTRKILENPIEQILDLDVGGAIGRRFRQSHRLTKGKEPLVALMNDGDAAGYGTLVIDGKLPGRRLAVVNLGSGTATAVLDDGQLLPGPCEGGKVMLDLGAASARDRSGANEYPRGVANAYLSRKFLPAMAGKLAGGQDLGFRVGPLRNREMGLFLFGDPRPLCQECGLRALAEEKSIGVEILRRVLEERDRAESDLRAQVARRFDVPDTAVIETLQALVDEQGLVRLSHSLGVAPEPLRHYFDRLAGDSSDHPSDGSSDAAIAEVEARMALFRETVVKPSLEALGCYLGDFLVFFATQYGANAFVVAGGVLRDMTGQPVRKAAVGRAARYGFVMRSRGSLLEIVRRPPWLAAGMPPGDHESTPARSDANPSEPLAGASASAPGYGTAGAAVFAAGEFLLNRRQQGLEELRSRILRLKSGDCFILADDRVRFQRHSVDDVHLPRHALGRKEVRQFLAGQRTVVQTESRKHAVRYIRIACERSHDFEA